MMRISSRAARRYGLCLLALLGWAVRVQAQQFPPGITPPVWIIPATIVLPVSIANGGTGAATAAANTVFGNNTGGVTAPAFTTTIAVPTVNATTAYQVNGTPITSGTTYLSSGSGMAVANVGANSCGTTAATIAGNNNASVITVGATAGTQCRITFTLTATTEWDCAANDDTTTIAVRTTPVSPTTTDLIGTFTAGDKLGNYILDSRG